MHTGELYSCNSPELFREQMECRALIHQYNQLDPRDMEGHQALLPRIFAEVGENCFFEPPFNANWGRYTHLGNNAGWCAPSTRRILPPTTTASPLIFPSGRICKSRDRSIRGPVMKG